MKWLKMDKCQRPGVSLMAILIMLLALPAINLIGHINQQMVLPSFLEPLEQWLKMHEETAGQLTEQFLHVDTYGGLVINILLMAVLPAVAEELSFRGVLMNLFPAKGDRVPHVAIWCTAILFSAVHMQFYGFLPRMLMGALFGYVLVWTGNLWVPILMHFTNNAMAVLLYFVSMRMNWDMKMIDAIGTNDTLWLGVVSLVITLVGIYAFRRSTTMSSASSRMSNGN
jgi:membrane protease YdiL (CAAX protease family)